MWGTSQTEIGRSASRFASVSAIQLTETCEAVTQLGEWIVKTTISSVSKSAFTEYTRNVLQQLGEQISNMGVSSFPSSW